MLATSVTLLAACASHHSNTPATTPTTSGRTAAPSDLIKHIVVLIQENHTFDSLFAGFPGADGEFAGQLCPDALPVDPPHQHLDALVPNGVTTPQARCSYDESSAAVYWQLAHEFTLCDRFFSDVRGPSQPNYLMLVAGQSPIVNAPGTSPVCPGFCVDIPTIVDRLDAARLTWRDYAGLLADIKRLAGRAEIAFNDDGSLLRNAADGTLPNVAWLNTDFLRGGDDKSGHPRGSLCRAENYAAQVINAVMAGPQWNSTALFLVWDDWGGFFDHVEPPIVETWTDGTPLRYGFRVPCLVVSPYARAGYISHQTHSLVSILRFIETLFKLEPLTERDARASDMLDCFDFSQAPRQPTALEPRRC